MTDKGCCFSYDSSILRIFQIKKIKLLQTCFICYNIHHRSWNEDLIMALINLQKDLVESVMMWTVDIVCDGNDISHFWGKRIEKPWTCTTGCLAVT